MDREANLGNDCSRVEKPILDFHFLQMCDKAVISQSGFGRLGTWNRADPLKDVFVFDGKRSFVSFGDVSPSRRVIKKQRQQQRPTKVQYQSTNFDEFMYGASNLALVFVFVWVALKLLKFLLKKRFSQTANSILCIFHWHIKRRLLFIFSKN